MGRETVKEEMAQARIASDQPLAASSPKVNPRQHASFNLKFSVILIHLLIGLITIIPTACQANQGDSIMNPDGLFLPNELEELNSIVNSFDAALMDSYSVDSFIRAYKAYVKEIYLIADQGQELKYYKEIESVFRDAMETDISNEVWWLDTSSQKGSLKVNINCSGKYMIYLQKVGESYPFINTYAQELLKRQDAGSAIILNAFAMNSENFDFSDRNIRLIFAIHYLTFYNL